MQYLTSAHLIRITVHQLITCEHPPTGCAAVGHAHSKRDIIALVQQVVDRLTDWDQLIGFVGKIKRAGVGPEGQLGKLDALINALKYYKTHI